MQKFAPFPAVFASHSYLAVTFKAKIWKRLAPAKSKLSNPGKSASPCWAYVFSWKEIQ
jgi:hypothetical protein